MTHSTEHESDLGEVTAAWVELAEAIVAYLYRTEEGDHLRIELPHPVHDDEETTTPYVQFAPFGDAMARVEISSNCYLYPEFHLSELDEAELDAGGWQCDDEDPDARNWFVEVDQFGFEWAIGTALATLRDGFGVHHPQLLTYVAFGPNADEAESLGLTATEDVPVENGPTVVSNPAPVAVSPTDRDHLHRLVGDALRRKYDTEPVIDKDGDYVLEHMGQPVWVHLRTDQPAVSIMARVAHNVHSRRQSAVEIGILNRDNVWVQWKLHDRHVWQSLHLPADPFAPHHLDAMLDVFLQAMTATCDDLAYRTGSRL